MISICLQSLAGSKLKTSVPLRLQQHHMVFVARPIAGTPVALPCYMTIFLRWRVAIGGSVWTACIAVTQSCIGCGKFARKWSDQAASHFLGRDLGHGASNFSFSGNLSNRAFTSQCTVSLRTRLCAARPFVPLMRADHGVRIGLFALSCAVYWNTLNGGFTFDDNFAVVGGITALRL